MQKAGIFCALAATGISIGYAIYKLRNVRIVSPELEEFVAEAATSIEDGSAFGEDDNKQLLVGQSQSCRKQRRVTATARAVAATKAQFGVIEDPSTADRMMVAKYIRDFLRKKGTHDIDIVEIAPLAAEMFWVKTTSECVAQQVQSTSVARAREASYGRHYVSWTYWFGRGFARQ